MSIKIWLTLLKMETNFMNAENGKTNEPNKFFYHLLTTLISKTQITKTLDWLI